MTARPHSLKTGCVAACASLLVACSTVDKPVEKMASLFTPYRVELIQGNVVTREQLAVLQKGMTRKQVRTSVLWESMVTAVVGVLIGTVLGVSLGWIIVRALRDQGLSSFSLPLLTIAVAGALSLVFAALAAFLPARRAARSDVLDAIATT